jgi:predicted metal-dependent hydrolase
LKLNKSPYDEVKLKAGFLVVASPDCNNPHHVKELVKAWYNERAREEISSRFNKIAPRFAHLGCKISAPTFRAMSRRWGSYTNSGRVSLNPDIVRAPIACIDYVIMHELVHTLQPNHGPKFFALMEAMMPDWRVRKTHLERLLS